MALDQRAPRRGFLKRLKNRSIGSPVPGVRLSDGTRVLDGHTFLGQVRDAGTGPHIYIFSRGQQRVAYIWVDQSGQPLHLPDCQLGPTDDESASILSGDVYTFREVRPGGALVVFGCTRPEAWQGWMLNEPRRSRRPRTAPHILTPPSRDGSTDANRSAQGE